MTWHTNTTGRSTDRPQGPEVYRPRYDQDNYDPVYDDEPCFGTDQDCPCGHCGKEE